MKLKDILNPKPIVESSLKVGSMIFVHGFPILKGLLSSQYYKVTKIDGDDISFQRVNKQGDVTNFTSGTITHKISSIEASIQNVGRADINGIEIVDESKLNESWTVKDGNVLSNGKLIGYYDFDRDSDSFWVDDVKKGKGQISFETKKEVEDYFKKNEKDAVKHLGKLRESTNPSDIIKDLDKVRTDLIKKVDVLIAKKKKLYSDVDITTPMSADEKQLDKDIQSIFSQIQQIIQQKRKIKNESINEEKVYIDFLNKKKGFKQDRIKFNSYEEAVKWARKNFDKFDPDMIKYESVNEDWSKEYKDSIDCNNPKGFSQKAHCAGKKKNETMLKLKNLLGEAKFETYHNTYTSAINAAKEWAEKQGYQINDDDSFTKIGMGPRKPSEGKTNRFSIEITKDGKPQRKMLHIQVYGMKSKYELNAYIG